MPQQCNACHSYPGLSTVGTDHILTAVHDRHVNALNAASPGYAFPCTTCHADFPTGHLNSGYTDGLGWNDTTVLPSTINIRFNGTRNPGTNLTYGPGDGDAGTTGISGHNGTCGNLYCHGDNTTSQTDWTGTGSPAWGNVAGRLACTGCHGDVPTTGAHQRHANSGSADRTDCNQCHTNVQLIDAATPMVATHVDNTIIPYLNSRIHAAEFRPVLCYLFTEWRCNIDCHYCFQFKNDSPGMTMETAKSALDWLWSIGCRVVPLMGGEHLIRKDFVLEVIRYGAQKGFFMYLPTNGYLLDKPFIDEKGEAGVAAVNLAVDCVAPRKGLPKALLNIESQFRYLVEQQKKYGYLLFFNINICRTNIKDVNMLTEIAHQNCIGTDYHLNDPPHFRLAPRTHVPGPQSAGVPR